MKKYLVLIFTLSFIFSFGQNAIVGNGFTCCWGNAGNSDYGYEYFDILKLSRFMINESLLLSKEID